jgi:hypothetical protein
MKEDHIMFGEYRQKRRNPVPRSLFLCLHAATKPWLAAVVTLALVLAVAATAANRTSTPRRGPGALLAAADLVALKQRCGAAEPLEESLQLVRQHAFSGRRSGAGKILAFEENRLFIYALADMSGGRDSEGAGGTQHIRWFFLLKPSTIVVEDLVRATVNKDEEGICEVFANLGKAGGCPSQSEATCRAVSAALRSGVDPKVMIDQLSGIRCQSTAVARKSNKEVDVCSCPDAIAQALEEALGFVNIDHGSSFKRKCEECGHPVRWEANCEICDFCGHSKCG